MVVFKSLKSSWNRIKLNQRRSFKKKRLLLSIKA